ncbi:DUF6716 putative glycosyltransferase [Galactobacter valiniphilus]|uniref:DUF6716 putative glycosyltransferase n=1 Tax=Galactobacter valiniphilus TaxID=2676122 RepID=UPI0037352CC0
MSGTILAIADSDSYLKYAVHFLEHLPQWRRQVMVVRSPVQPTSVQTRAALEGTFLQGRTPAVLPLKRLAANANPAPDVVLVAATGPVAREVLLQWSGSPRRPALVTALPGIALPATRLALTFRELSDLFLVHSLAEGEEFARLGGLPAAPLLLPVGGPTGVGTVPDDAPDDAGAEGPDPERPADDGPDPADAPLPEEEKSSPAVPAAAEDLVPPAMALARLPMLHHHAPPATTEAPVTRLVFAAQAKMPFEREERRRVLLELAACARERPGVDVVLKLRARRGEPQTHREAFPYDALWDELIAEGLVRGNELSWEAGPLAPLLTPGTALVTVSSTAAIEAIDRGLPVAILSDFGVSERLLNSLFTGSGLLTTLAEVRALRLPTLEPGWAQRNYFHTPSADGRAWPDAGVALAELAQCARRGELSQDPAIIARARSRAWRARLRTRLPQPVLRASQLLRQVTG